MSKYSGIELVKKLCEIYGPTGFEYKVAEFIREQTEGLCEYLPDRMGNLVCLVRGSGEGYNSDAPTKIMISAHMDEVGFIIKSVEDDGSIKFILDGGIDSKVLAGRSVVLFNEENIVKGVIDSKAIHSLSPEERKEALTPDKLYINIGAANAEQVTALVDVGDYGTFDSDFVIFGENDKMMKSKAIDDRLGCAVMIEIMRKLSEDGIKLPYDLYFAFTVREEIGNSGAQTVAQTVRPDFAIVLETTAIADIAGVPKNSRVGDVGEGGVISLMDRSTIYDREFVDLALELAKESGAELAILKANSPSCGNKSVYDGSFSGKLRAGAGVTSALLMKNGIEVISEYEVTDRREDGRRY